MRIRVIDVETTGTEPTDAIIEIGAWDLIDGKIDAASSIDTLVNPGRPIPPELSAIHHIVDTDVADAPKLDQVLPLSIDGADAFCAHNAKFERQWFTEAVTGGRPWICTLRCAYIIWPDAPGHSNQTLRYWLKAEGLDRQIANVAHRAAPDAYVTAFTLRELLKRASFDELVRWSNQPALLPRITFGKHRGQRFADVPIDYLQWLTRQNDMNEDVIHSARFALKARAA